MIYNKDKDGKIDINVEELRASLKSTKREEDESFEDYKTRMRITNKAVKVMCNGRIAYNSANMVPFKVG